MVLTVDSFLVADQDRAVGDRRCVVVQDQQLEVSLLLFVHGLGDAVFETLEDDAYVFASHVTANGTTVVCVDVEDRTATATDARRRLVHVCTCLSERLLLGLGLLSLSLWLLSLWSLLRGLGIQTCGTHGISHCGIRRSLFVTVLLDGHLWFLSFLRVTSTTLANALF
ncbi:hypothetical protein D3C84_898480 [compost metagenome]